MNRKREKNRCNLSESHKYMNNVYNMTQEKKKEYVLFLVHKLSKIFIYLQISMDVVLAFIILLACNLAKTIVHPKMKTTNLLMTWNILHKMDHIYNIFLEYFSPFIKLEIIHSL